MRALVYATWNLAVILLVFAAIEWNRELAAYSLLTSVVAIVFEAIRRYYDQDNY